MGTNAHHPRPGGTGQPAARQNLPPVQYFNAEGIINEALLDEEAEKQAKILQSVDPSQLRRFFEDVLSLRRRLDHETANMPRATKQGIFEALRPEFKMLRAKAFYANGRNKNVFPDELRVFFERHVAAVQTVKDFDVFCKHFQAVVAFHKYYRELLRRGGR